MVLICKNSMVFPIDDGGTVSQQPMTGNLTRTAIINQDALAAVILTAATCQKMADGSMVDCIFFSRSKSYKQRKKKRKKPTFWPETQHILSPFRHLSLLACSNHPSSVIIPLLLIWIGLSWSSGLAIMVTCRLLPLLSKLIISIGNN